MVTTLEPRPTPSRTLTQIPGHRSSADRCPNAYAKESLHAANLSLALTTLLFVPTLLAQSVSLASIADLTRQGQFPRAIEAANAFLADTTTSSADQAIALVYLGHAYQLSGEFPKASSAYEHALAIVNRDGQHPSDYAATLANLAALYAEIGQPETARHVLLRAMHLFELQNDHAGAAMVWNNLATLAAEQHARRDAHKDMAHCIKESGLATSMTPGELAAIATTQGRLAALDSNPHAAIADFHRALDLLHQTGNDQDAKLAWLNVLLGEAYLQDADLPHARESTARGLATLASTSSRDTRRFRLAQLTYAKILEASGANAEASTLRQQAQSALAADPNHQHPPSTINVSALR